MHTTSSITSDSLKISDHPNTAIKYEPNESKDVAELYKIIEMNKNLREELNEYKNKSHDILQNFILGERRLTSCLQRSDC